MTHLVHVAVRHEADHAVVAVAGRVFTDTIDPLRDALTALLEVDRPRIILDLSAVEICDSSGLNLIAGSHYTATGKGGWLRVAGLQPLVRRVVDVTNLDRLLSIHATVDDAATGDPAAPPGGTAASGTPAAGAVQSPGRCGGLGH